MAEVENERVSQGNGFLIKARVIGQTVEKACVGIEGIGEVEGDFFTLVMWRARIKPGCTAQCERSSQRSKTAR